MKSLSPSFRRRRGFSLAEVMIALGIVAFVMMGLLGTMARGTQSVQNATNTLIYGKIAEQMVNDIQQLNWKDFLTEFPAEREFYYDYQGFPTSKETASDGDSAVDSQVSFVAKLRYNTETNVSASGNIYDNELMRKVQILVEYTPGGKPPRWEFKPKSGDVRVKSFVYMITNQNKISRLEQQD